MIAKRVVPQWTLARLFEANRGERGQLRSIADSADPESSYAALVVPAYFSSKAALDMLTTRYARAFPRKATDVMVQMATVGPDGPTATFVGRAGRVPWQRPRTIHHTPEAAASGSTSPGDATTTPNQQRRKTKVTMPVLAIGGARSSMGAPEMVMDSVATDVRGLVIPGAGHFVAEEAPDAVLARLSGFLEPYRTGA